MDGNIQPANIFAALFLTQVLLSGIVIVAAILLQDSDALWPIVAMVGLAAAALTLSEFLVVLWRPVFGGLWVPSLGLGVTRAFVFLVDIVGLFFLVVLSGGSRNSPF